MPTARVNGIETQYERHGQGVPALFIHGGYGGAATTLAPQPSIVPSILPADEIETITYDRRSAGLSAYISTPYSVADLAADAAALLDELGHERAIVIGSSAGGPIALQFALSYPERVIGLALPNTGANLSSTERAVGRERRDLVARAAAEGEAVLFAERREKLRQSPAAGALPPGASAAEAEQRRQKLTQALAAISDDDLLRYFTGELRNYGAYIDVDLAPRLGELHMPVCIIHGDADAVVPYAWGEELFARIPGAEFHQIPGGGHGILAWPAAAAALRVWALALVKKQPAA
jgi:pimeloyl-ACP methyl ester carboxylesterase